MKHFLIKLNAVRVYDPLYGVLDTLRWNHIKHFVPEHYTREHLRMRSNYNWFIRVLLWIGFVRIGRKSNAGSTISGEWQYSEPETILSPFRIPPNWNWFVTHCKYGPRVYLLRNNPGVIKWLPGTLLPMRWGFVVCGFEFGQRG